MTFPLLAKPMSSKTPDAGGEAGDVQWNLEKFLLARGAAVVNRFRPRTVPDAPEVLCRHWGRFASIAEKTAAVRVLDTVASPEIATM